MCSACVHAETAIYDVCAWFEDLSSERRRSDEMQRCPAASEGVRVAGCLERKRARERPARVSSGCEEEKRDIRITPPPPNS